MSKGFSLGGEAARDGGPLPNFGGRLDGWNQSKEEAKAKPAAPAAPAAPAEVKPTFSKEELGRVAHLAAEVGDAEPETGADDEADSLEFPGFTEQQVSGWRAQLKRGSVTVAELQRVYSLGDAEIEKLGGKPLAEAPPRKSVEAELAEIAAMRKSDPKKYWSEETQLRERELLQAQIDGDGPELEAAAEEDDGGEEVEGEPDADDAELANIKRRLQVISEDRKKDPRSYDNRIQAEELALLARQEVLEAGAGTLEPELIDRWRTTGGIEANLQAAKDAALRAGDEFDNVVAVIDALPTEASIEIVDYLRLDHAPVRGTEKERLAEADRRISGILNSMSAEAADETEAALKKLSKAQLKAILDVIAPRA